MQLSAVGRSPVSLPSRGASLYPSRRRITPLVNMVGIGVLISSATCTSLTPQLTNGSTRLLSRTPLTHSPSETLHVTFQLSVRPATRTGTCRFRSSGGLERLRGCSSGLRCTTPSITRTSTPLTSFRDRARSAQSATPSQPEIRSSGSSFSGEERPFNVDRFPTFDRLLAACMLQEPVGSAQSSSGNELILL